MMHKQPVNKWELVNEDEEYKDFELEAFCFGDENQTSIDIRVSFVKESHHAYIVLMKRDNDGDTQEFGPGQINVTWEEGVRLVAEPISGN